MSVNRYRPHLFVLPEDDANRQLANGFLLSISTRQMQVLTEAGGWTHVRDRFASGHIANMRKYTDCFMLLLVDFDNDTNRLREVMSAIPADLSDRVFVLGALTEPEDLRAELGTYETIGQTMASDCRDATQTIWLHKLLKHNEPELGRLRTAVWDLLFGV
jgi:hypothetical protein